MNCIHLSPFVSSTQELRHLSQWCDKVSEFFITSLCQKFQRRWPRSRQCQLVGHNQQSRESHGGSAPSLRACERGATNFTESTGGEYMYLHDSYMSSQETNYCMCWLMMTGSPCSPSKSSQRSKNNNQKIKTIKIPQLLDVCTS